MEEDSGLGKSGLLQEDNGGALVMGAVLLLACSGHGKTYMGKIYMELNTGMHMPSHTFMYTLTYVCKTHTCMHTFTHVCIHPSHTCKHNPYIHVCTTHSPTVQVHTITYMHVHTISHTLMHILQYIMYRHLYMHMYTHIHTHTANAYIHPWAHIYSPSHTHTCMSGDIWMHL